MKINFSTINLLNWVQNGHKNNKTSISDNTMNTYIRENIYNNFFSKKTSLINGWLKEGHQT